MSTSALLRVSLIRLLGIVIDQSRGRQDPLHAETNDGERG
jgi:hypothetical protein